MLLRTIKAELIPISTTLERTELVRTSIKSNGLKKKNQTLLFLSLKCVKYNLERNFKVRVNHTL